MSNEGCGDFAAIKACLTNFRSKKLPPVGSQIGNFKPKMRPEPSKGQLPGLGKTQQKLVAEGIMILNRAGLDFTKAANLMWAPNRAGQHTFGNLEQVVQKLRKIERTAQPSRNSKLRRSSKKVTNMNPVLQAIKNDDLETFARLVGNDEALRNGPNAFGSWLHYASSKGRLPFVKYLVENGADVNLCAILTTRVLSRTPPKKGISM